MAAVFDYSDITKYVRAEAERRMVSPWTLLGGALTRAALATPFTWRLPAIVEDDASLNALIVHAGPSGSGKGAGKAEIFAWPDVDPFNLDDGEQRLADVFSPITVASGEAFGSLFFDNQTVPGIDGKGKVTVPVRIRHAAWTDFDEVDQLTAMASRQGATLTAEVRKVWSGSGIGTYTKVKANRVVVRAHSYRLVLTVAAQPLRCAGLMAEEAGGTLQRILWLSADTPDLDDLADLDAGRPADPMAVTLPDFTRGMASPGDDGPVRYFDVDDEVRAEIRADRRAKRWKDEDAHRNLVRLKAAAAVAVLHGSTAITAEVWKWAGALMDHSDRTRAAVRKDLAAIQDAKTRDQAVSQAITGITADSVRETAIEKVADAMERWLRKNPGKTPTADAMRKAAVANADRSLVPEALDLLLNRRTIAEAGPSRVGTPTYRLTKGGTG